MNLLTHTRHKHVVSFSGGAGSWAAAKLVAAKYGTDDLILLFADTLIEDYDLYRFLDEAAANVGGKLVKIADGRTPWQVFKDKRYLGNTQKDPCSEILKRNLLQAWIEAHCDPANTTIYVGIDASEEHRIERLARRKQVKGWTYRAPLVEANVASKLLILAKLADEGIIPPRLYVLGFAHNNCGGGCVKAGQGQFVLLYEKLPDVFAEWEHQEADWQRFTGKSNTILRDRRGGELKPLPLSELRRRIEAGEFVDRLDIGGCGCAIDDGPDADFWPDDI